MKINNTITIKNEGGKYYLFLQDNKRQDIFINGSIARLELKKSQPIIHTLNDQIGIIQFAPSKKDLRFNITRYAGENNIYKIGKKLKRILSSETGDWYEFWEIEGVWETHLDYLLETIYYHQREAIIKNIKDYKDFIKEAKKRVEKDKQNLTPNPSNMNIGGWFKDKRSKQEYEDDLAYILKYEEDIKINEEKLKELYQWELGRENSYRKSNNFWRTNPQHVNFLKESIKLMEAEARGEVKQQERKKLVIINGEDVSDTWLGRNPLNKNRMNKK